MSIGAGPCNPDSCPPEAADAGAVDASEPRVIETEPGPFLDCAILADGAVTDDGIAEDATLIEANDGSVIASYITGSQRTLAQLRRYDEGVWSEPVTIANSRDPQVFWEANFNNLVQTRDGQFHLIGGFASAGDLFSGDGRVYVLSSLADASGNYSWDRWPDFSEAVPITGSEGFDFGAVARSDLGGRIWVVFLSDRASASGATDNLWLLSRDPAGQWGEPDQITTSALRDMYPQMHLDRDGRLQVGWVRSPGDRITLLDGAGVGLQIVAMSSEPASAQFGVERVLIESTPTSINTFATVLEGPRSSYVSWLSADFAVPDQPGTTLVQSLTDDSTTEFEGSAQLHRSLRLSDGRYLHTWNADFATGDTTIRYREYDCAEVEN